MSGKKKTDMPYFRPLSKADKEAINDCFTPYLFYETINRDGDRLFTCSHCGKTFLIPAFARTVTDDIYELQRVRHNDEYNCPKCKIGAIIKNKGRAKTCQNLYEQQRVCIIQTQGENQVYIRCFYASKSYKYGGYNPKIKLNECCRYYLTPTVQRKYKEFWYTNGWGEYEAVSEPFIARNAMGWPCDNSYIVIGLNRLKSTFLKYNMLDEYAKRRTDYLLNVCRDIMKAEIRMIKYLVYFAKYPQIEILQKLGHYDVVENLIEAGLKSAPFVNWKAKTVYEFFKMSKHEYKEFVAAGGTLDDLKSRKALLKAIPNPSWETVARYEKECEGCYRIERAINAMQEKGLPIRQGLDYLIKQNNKRDYYDFRDTMCEYEDYYRMATKLGYDIANPVVYFPKDLKRAHDDANRNYQLLLDKEKAENERKAMKANEALRKQYVRQYAFSDGTFSIVIPSGIEDIIREGKLQQHCVGGYAHRHVEGKLTICFLRRTDDINTPLYTIEMHGDRLQQVQGKENKTPLTPEAKVFFDTWLDWVRSGSKHYKDGTPKLPKTAVPKTA